MKATQLQVERYSETHSFPPQVPHFVLHGIIVKSCAKCGSVKPLEEFAFDLRTWDNYDSRCMACGGTPGAWTGAGEGGSTVSAALASSAADAQPGSSR